MSSLNYGTFVTQISNLAVIGSTDPNFQTMLPGAIDYFEQRMYRELDLQVTRITNIAGILSTSARTTSLSTTSGYILIPESLSILTPAGATTSAARNPVTFTTKQVIDNIYGDPSFTGRPIFAAMMTDASVLLGPAPDQPYSIEVTGTVRPTPLSSGNSSTWLTQNLPDMCIACSMIFVSGYMRDFGMQTDNPQQAQSWENQFQLLKGSASIEELRKQYRSQGWTSAQPNPIATPPRV